MIGQWGDEVREAKWTADAGMSWRDRDDRLGHSSRGDASYDYTPAGALMFSYPKDDEFTRQLRELVPTGMMHWQRNPFCWIIDQEYAEDVLKMAYQYFDDVFEGLE